MPEIPTRPLDGLRIDWTLVRTDEHVRCVRCRACYPGRLMAKVGEDGICEECREKEPPLQDDIDSAKRQWEDNHAD